MLKLSMWMGALILAGLVQGAQDAQDVLGRLWLPAFRITVLVSIHQYSSVLVSIAQYWPVVSELRGAGAGVGLLPGTERSAWLRRSH